MVKINFGSVTVSNSDSVLPQFCRTHVKNLSVDGGLLASEVLFCPIFKNLACVSFHVLSGG